MLVEFKHSKPRLYNVGREGRLMMMIVCPVRVAFMFLKSEPFNVICVCAASTGSSPESCNRQRIEHNVFMPTWFCYVAAGDKSWSFPSDGTALSLLFPTPEELIEHPAHARIRGGSCHPVPSRRLGSGSWRSPPIMAVAQDPVSGKAPDQW
jgi:hypothetical protein